MGIVEMLQKCLDIDLMQHTVKDTNKYAWQQAKIVTPFTFRSRITKWQDATVDEMNVVLALFMLMGILQKPTQKS
jgi:hypothetical protein